jgi:hypothetical protein
MHLGKLDYKCVGALEHDARDADGDDQRLDPDNRAARHLPRHRDRSAGAGLLRGGKYHHQEIEVSDIIAVEEAA